MGEHVTIADVANYLGVSKSTVSHALSGKRRISSEVRGRVQRAIAELGYRPNFAAQVMNTRQTGLVGVLVDSLSNPHTTTLLEEFGRELSLHSIQMVLGSTDRLDDGRKLLAKFSNGMVDGILNTLPGLDENEAQELAGGVPLVTYRRHREAPLVIDFAAGVRAAIAYLEKLGHRRIAIIPSDTRARHGAEDPCLAAYREEMALRKSPPLIFPAPGGNIQSGIEAAEMLFGSDATAVLAGNDAIAAGLIQWANARGIRLPERMSIIGHDDSPLAAMTSPPLTSIRLPIKPIAVHTVQVLMHAINPDNSMPEPLMIIPELAIRNSTSPEAAITK